MLRLSHTRKGNLLTSLRKITRKPVQLVTLDAYVRIKKVAVIQCLEAHFTWRQIPSNLNPADILSSNFEVFRCFDETLN